VKEVLMVCDGSSVGNGKANPRAAAVALLGFKGNWKAVGEYLGEATNQQAEIAAATIGLQSLREPCRVKILSDSRYVVETMCGRFRRKTNHDWWQKLDAAAKTHTIVWQWTKGHAGDTLQEAVDTAARKIATLGTADAKILDQAAETAKTAKI
jgi:ribonuclease HI